jgi:hypothetical protein
MALVGGECLAWALWNCLCKMQQLLGTSSYKRVGRDQFEVNAGSISMGVDSADIVAVESRSGPLKPSKG